MLFQYIYNRDKNLRHIKREYIYIYIELVVVHILAASSFFPSPSPLFLFSTKRLPVSSKRKAIDVFFIPDTRCIIYDSCDYDDLLVVHPRLHLVRSTFGRWRRGEERTQSRIDNDVSWRCTQSSHDTREPLMSRYQSVDFPGERDRLIETGSFSYSILCNSLQVFGVANDRFPIH